MERFQLETPSDLAANHARHMAVHVWGEDLSVHTSAVLNICGNCGEPADRLTFIPEFGIFECDICMEDAVRVLAEEEAKPICATATAIYNTVQTVGEMCDAMKAHRAECAICGCTRKDVVSDRLMVNAAAVCCGKAVA